MKTKQVKRALQDIVDSTLTPSAASKGVFPSSNEGNTNSK